MEAKAKAEPVAAKADAKADEETFRGIDAAFAASGKDAAEKKAEAVSTLEVLAKATAFTVPRRGWLFVDEMKRWISNLQLQ